MQKLLIAAIALIVGLVSALVLPEKAKGPKNNEGVPPGFEQRAEQGNAPVGRPSALPVVSLPPPAASAHAAKSGELAREVARKKTPKISTIFPVSVALNAPLTISGSGFTLVGNRILVKGKTVLTDLVSVDGETLSLALPVNTPCIVGPACPIKVINANGISNAKPVRIVASVELPSAPSPSSSPSPTPTPAPLATPTPTPVPAAPQIDSIAPSYGSVGAVVTITGSGFTKTNNAVHFGGTKNAVSGLASADGITIVFIVPSVSTCVPVATCAVSVSNANGTSNTISFTLTQPIVPVTITLPNGGEEFIPGLANAIRWSGGKHVVQLALVQASATNIVDPSDLVFGWLKINATPDSSFLWDAKQACSPDLSLCWPVPPGTYKILAASENEFGNVVLWDYDAAKPGNFDVSDAPFTVLEAPRIGVVTPNGGESFTRGTTVTLGWETVNIVSRLVNINLLKGGVFSHTIAANVALDTASGLFTTAWAIPGDLAIAADYTIEVSDAANAPLRDVSDASFSVVSAQKLTILAPNGGETVMRGFKVLVFWDYGGYTPATITINLYKGGAFYRTLATGVKPASFSGFTFLRGSYPLTARYAEEPIGLDIPEGTDYTLEITDGTDASIRDVSNAPFRVITMVSPTTFTGRLVDSFTNAPLPNVGFGGYSGGSNMDGTSFSITLPRFTSDANGAFSTTATTSDMVAITRYKTLLAGWPQCNDALTAGLYRYVDIPRTNFGGWFGDLYPLSSVRNQYFALTSSAVNFGDIPSWPTAKMILSFTDIPSAFSIYYTRPDGTVGGGGGNSNYTITHVLSNDPPLGVDAYVKFVDKAGATYTSPAAKFSTDARCQLAVLSYIEGTFRWEPYVVGFYLSQTSSPTAGAFYSATLKPYTSPYYYGTGNQGVAPFTWGMAYGALPPGLSLNMTTGEIAGIPATAGTYVFGVKVKDANGVRASQDLPLTVK